MYLIYVLIEKVMLIFKHEFTVYYPSLSIFRHLQFTSIRDNCFHKLSVIKLPKLWIPYLAYEVLFKGCFSLLDFCKSGYFWVSDCFLMLDAKYRCCMHLFNLMNLILWLSQLLASFNFEIKLTMKFYV